MNEFFYGALRAMDQQYLIRTAMELWPDINHVEIVNKFFDTPLGDDKVTIFYEIDDEPKELCLAEFCYDIADELEKEMKK